MDCATNHSPRAERDATANYPQSRAAAQVFCLPQRLLYVGAERTAASLRRFFDMLGQARTATLAFICSDMGKPYLGVIAECAGQAVHGLDRYHVMA